MRFPASPIPATAASHGSWFRPMAGRRGRRRRSRSRCTRRLLPASARPGAGMAVPQSCKVAPGTKPATRNRLAPSSWPCGARPRSRLRIFSRSPTSTTTASRAGGSTAMGRSNMSTLKLVLAFVLALVLGSRAALAQTPRLGKPISEADIKAWDIAVMPDGTGLPPSSGIETPKTIGNFFGYSTIVFDFVRRAMPFSQPRTLTGDEVYAATAYLLWLNKIIGENDVMDAKTLPQVKMPNRDGFIIRFPDKI